ncbi:MAG TPA: GHKL domain-containing protein [Candidatus Blautia excrementipullorum]|nr:GHKL domain-containing protein [Candidatus Blautia excrementipullorum]
MMDWIRIFSYLFTNELRLLLGLCLVTRLTNFSLEQKVLLLTAAGGCLVTVLQAVSLPSIGVIAAEVLVISAAAWYYLREKLNLCLFLAIIYEIGVALWDFLFQAGLGILFRSENYVDPNAPEHFAGIWLVRLVMLGIAVLLAKQKKKSSVPVRLASAVVMLGLFGAVSLSEQTILPLSDDQTGTWVILSMVLLFSVLFYRLSRQREMESEIAQLKQDQAEILERDYQALSRTYENNAKLYHDLHNHIEAIYQCLTQGAIQEAIRYCGDLRTPVREISQTVWTGDKAIDYLISSKMATAEQEQIRTKVNIEYPHNTNIRSVDLTTILGNLLDNALEAAKTAPDKVRFLNLTIRRINAMLIIKVENGYGNAPKQINGNLITSKDDKASHGWGLKSVQTAADRYDGTITTDYENGVFRSVVTLSFQPIRTESSLL